MFNFFGFRKSKKNRTEPTAHDPVDEALSNIAIDYKFNKRIEFSDIKNFQVSASNIDCIDDIIMYMEDLNRRRVFRSIDDIIHKATNRCGQSIYYIKDRAGYCFTDGFILVEVNKDDKECPFNKVEFSYDLFYPELEPDVVSQIEKVKCVNILSDMKKERNGVSDLMANTVFHEDYYNVDIFLNTIYKQAFFTFNKNTLDSHLESAPHNLLDRFNGSAEGLVQFIRNKIIEGYQEAVRNFGNSDSVYIRAKSNDGKYHFYTFYHDRFIIDTIAEGSLRKTNGTEYQGICDTTDSNITKHLDTFLKKIKSINTVPTTRAYMIHDNFFDVTFIAL